jgi:excisionase family DNA binding protein
MSEIPDSAMSPLPRARRRLEARLRLLDDRLRDHPEDEALWARYISVVCALAALAGNQASLPMVTTQQLADSLGVSAETIRDRVKQGRLQPAAKFGGRGGYRFRAGQRPT